MEEAKTMLVSLYEPIERIKTYLEALDNKLLDNDDQESRAFSYAIQRDTEEIDEAIGKIEKLLIEETNKSNK